MEAVKRTCKASKFASKDIISNMPKNVITDILDRLPIQDAVKTSILSRKWRFRWTTLSQLIFDEDFINYLAAKDGGDHEVLKLFYRENLGRILLHHKGFITKFILHIPSAEYGVMDADFFEDLNHWILFLPTKKIKKFVLINNLEEPLKLSTHLFSCEELKHLKLLNCCLHPVPKFDGFPKLLSFNFDNVTFQNCKFGEFITRCPLLKILDIEHETPKGEVKAAEIATLKDLRILKLMLRKLDSKAITSCGIFELMSHFRNLWKLELNFIKCKFLVEAGGARKRFFATLPSLKTLSLQEVDFRSKMMVLCACDLINGCSNLVTLKITGAFDLTVSPETADYGPSSALGSLKNECGITGKLPLQIVILEYIRGWENEVCLIKLLLAHSFSLKEMVINRCTPCLYDDHQGCCALAKKLLKLHRASPSSEIDAWC